MAQAIDEDHNGVLKAQMLTLEWQQGRALRELALGDTSALARLQTLDQQIAALRAQLTPE